MAFWNQAVAGSQFSVEPVDVTGTINTVKNSQPIFLGAVGTLQKNDYENFIASLEKGTMKDFIEALKIRDLTGELVPFDPTKYYRLQNVLRSGVLQINTQNGTDYKKLAQSSMNQSDINMLWRIETLEENAIKLYHINAGEYAGSPTNTTLSEVGTKYIKVDWGEGNFGFKHTADNQYLVQFRNGNIGGWNEPGKGTDHVWYIIPADNILLRISEAGYATANYPFAVRLPENLTAYTGNVQIQTDSKVLLLTEIQEKIIPANTPVVLAGNSGDYTLTIETEYSNSSILSDLKGTLLPETIEKGVTVYGLGYLDNKIGFYKMSETDRTIGANKAYLPNSQVLQGVKGVTFSFDDNNGETTNIENVTINLEEEEFYDLQGHRIINPTKGIYVTKSGKKVLFTK